MVEASACYQLERYPKITGAGSYSDGEKEERRPEGERAAKKKRLSEESLIN